MKELIEYIEEGLLAGMEDTLKAGDNISADMCKLHWTHMHNQALSGKLYYSLSAFRDKYFIKNVPAFKTDIFRPLSDPDYKANKTYRFDRIHWFIAYMLELELGVFAEDFDFSDTDKLTELFTEHFNKILNDEGKNMLVFRVTYSKYKDLFELQIFEKNSPSVEIDPKSNKPQPMTCKYYLSVYRPNK